MLEKILTSHQCSLKLKITVKTLLSVALVMLSVVLPQLVHLVAGAQGGIQWLPMYLPVIIGGCLLGSIWGVGVSVISPIASFLLTFAFGNPMPALERLPFMIVELAVIALVCGLFSKKIAQNGWMAFPAVLLSFVAGRTSFMLTILIFSSLTSFTPSLIWNQIQSGLLGMTLQSVLVPFIIMGFKFISDRDKNNDR